MFRALGDAEEKDKWSIRAEEWDRKIEEEKRRLNAGFPLGAVTAPLAPVGQYSSNALSSLRPLKEELEFHIQDRFKALGHEIRDIVEREWRVKLPEVEYGIKEKHAELKELFDRNTRTALNIGDKVLETTTNVNSLKKDLKLIEGWKKEHDLKLGENVIEVQDIRSESTTLKKQQMELSKGLETLGIRMKEIEELKVSLHSTETRLQTYCKEEIRQNERRSELRVEQVTDKMQQLIESIGADSEAWRSASSRLAAAEEATKAAVRDLAKIKSKLSNHLNELNEQSDEIEELRNEIKEMTQNTVPGYCQGCRLVMQEMENKLYTVNQTICYLDKTVKSGRADVPAVQPAAPKPPTSEPPQHPSIPLLERRIESLESELSSMRSTIELLRMEAQRNREDRRQTDDLTDMMHRMLADSEAAVLDQVKGTLALESEENAKEINDLKEHIVELLRRVDTVEDKLDID